MLITLVSCTGAHYSVRSSYSLPRASENISKIKKIENSGYVVQVGAFTSLDNAARFEDKLDAAGLDAYFYREKVRGRWFYRVRFGNYISRQQAAAAAETYRRRGVITDYFIVSPGSFSVAQKNIQGTGYIRDRLVETARNYLGVPYRWGGTSERTGFDCSGLTMVVYRLNGMNLPRVSRNQFKYGNKVRLGAVKKGDLVFFATGSNRSRVSHVGIYIGGGKFIHAPGRGKTVRIAKLSNSYFRKRFLGARTYM